MKKKLTRIIGGVLLSSLIFIAGITCIILYPERLFANKLEYRQFNVYSNSPIDKHIKTILDNALTLAMGSELYDSAYYFDIFLSYNSFYNKIDNILLGREATARATSNNVTIKVAVDIKRNRLFPTFHQKCEADLTYIIAHEMVHCLQEHKYGKLKFNPFRPPELWKLEGYPEYVSRRPQILESDYDLATEINRYIELENKLNSFWMPIDEGGCEVPYFYYKSRLLTEYLMDIKHLTYDKILMDTISEDLIYNEMLRWKNATLEINNEITE